jgi:hypothetical protein
MAEKRGTGSRLKQASSRTERLARALRDNLKRRKAQARGRSDERRPARPGDVARDASEQ